MKEAMYSSRSMQRRQISSAAYIAGDMDMDDELPTFMRRKKRQGKKRE